MARINLLPWRENLRKKRQRDFGIAALVSVLVVAVACAGAHFYIEGMIKHQEKRNGFLKREIAEMDKKIKEIEELEKTKAKLIARMNVIQELQGSRPQIVHLFDELVETIPDGTFLTKLEQQGSSLSMDGRAQSNARVSAYMRNIETSEWLGNPSLKVISNESKNDEELSTFTLNARQITQAKDGEQKQGNQGKGGKG